MKRYVPREKIAGSCLYCGGAFLGWKQRKYCCNKCYQLASNRRDGSVSLAEYRLSVKSSRNNFVCEHCGKPSHRALGGAAIKLGKKNRFCSKACQFGWRAVHRPASPKFTRVHENTCERCGKVWIARRRKKLCGCEPYAKPRPPTPSVCAGCGCGFTAIRHRRKFCSKRCLKAYYKRIPESREKHGISGRRWAALRLKAIERDEYRCWICGVTTEPSADPNDDLYPNADHVIPFSAGGPTELDNLRCACRACNMRKAASMPIYRKQAALFDGATA